MEFKKFKAAAVQTSPVFLNVEKTIEKAISFVKEATSNGANLIAFPEVFVAGYPYRSEEHTSELQSPKVIAYAVFCL